MTSVQADRLVIVVKDNDPAERRQWLIQALAAALRHMALSAHKRTVDGEHAAVITELIEELAREQAP
jgi:hypothetical protein